MKHLGFRELLLHWVGPFTIERRIAIVAYPLALNDSMHRVQPKFHVSKLAKHCTDGWYQPPPPPIELKSELEYEVEKILDKLTCAFSRRTRIDHPIY